jgi:hypothetical protein
MSTENSSGKIVKIVQILDEAKSEKPLEDFCVHAIKTS